MKEKKNRDGLRRNKRKVPPDAFDIAPHDGKFLWIASICYFMGWFMLLWIGHLPWYLLLVKGGLCIPALVVMWKYTSKHAKKSCVFPTIAMILVYATFWISTHPIGILLQIILLPVLIGVCIYLYMKYEFCFGLLAIGAETLQIFFLLMTTVDRYTFHANNIPFWQVVLAVALPVSIVLTVWLLKKAGFHIGGMLGGFFAFCLISSLIVWIYAAHLNYALDTTPPVTHVVKIENKKVDNNRKSADDYELCFTLNGKTFWHEVTFEEYGRYEIGDTYHLEAHGGAFGVPYLISSEGH